MTADGWLDRLADELGERRLEPAEISAILKVARDVAHGVERRLAPLTAYVLGLYVGRETTEGTPPDEALGEATRAARSMIPPGGAEPDQPA